MQSALWKVITATGIIGIGTLVVLEVQQRLPPMQPGTASGLTAGADPHASHDGHSHAEHTDETPFFEAAADDPEDLSTGANAVAAPGTPGVVKSTSVRGPQGTTGSRNPATASVRSAQVYTNLPKKADSTTDASSPESPKNIDTTVNRDALADSLDPFAVTESGTDDAVQVNSPASSDEAAVKHETSDAAAATAPTDGDKDSATTAEGIKVASFQRDAFNGGSPFEEETSQPPGTPDDAARFPALQTPPGVTDDNPFGEPFVRDAAPAGESETPGASTDSRNRSEDLPLPSADQPEDGPFFPEDKPAVTPEPAEVLPEISLPTFPADDRSDNDSANDRAGSERPRNDSGSNPPADPERKRGSSIMFFGNDSQKNSRSSSERSESERKQPFESEGAGRDQDGVNRAPAPVFENDLDGNIPDEDVSGRNVPGGNAPRDLPEFPAPVEDRRLPPLDRPDPRETPRETPRGGRDRSDQGRDSRGNDGSEGRDELTRDDMFEPDVILPPADSNDAPDRNSPREDSEGTVEAVPTTEVMRPHLTLRKDAPQTATVGVPLEYRIQVSNDGKHTAYDVIVEDEIPRTADLGTQTPQAEFDRANQKMFWKFDSLNPGEIKEIFVTVTPRGEGTLGGVATVRFKAQVKATTMVTAPKLSLKMEGPAEARSGDELNYRFVVRNDGSGIANEVILRTTLPAQLKHSEGDDLEYEIDTLEPNEEREIVLTLVANKPGEEKFQAEVISTAESVVQRELPINVIGAQLKLERLGPERRYVGRPAEFQNIVTNETRFEATDIIIRESVPEGMKFVSAKSGGEYDARKRIITWEIPRIEAEKQVLLDVELIPETAGEQETVVEVQELKGFRSNVVKIVAVEDLHNITAETSRLDGAVQIGEKFKFSITIENRGTALAGGVQLVVKVPPEIKILEGGTKEENIVARRTSKNEVVYNPVESIKPGEKKVFHLVLQGQEEITNGLVEGRVNYSGMKNPLIVSETVTIFSDSP